MKLRTSLYLFAFFAIVNLSYGQTEEERIKETIMTMFNGMRNGDSAMVHSAFSTEVLMQTIANNQEGKVEVHSGSLTDFLKAVGTPHNEAWDERIEFDNIKIDGAMSSVWTPYEFYRGETFSHCGVNSFQLYKGAKGWKIIYLVDTRRKEGCK